MKRKTAPKKIKLQHKGLRRRIFAALIVAVLGTYLVGRSLAAAAHIYITPASASNIAIGATFTTQVRIKTTSPINAAFINMGYDASGLQVVGIQRGSAFPNQNAPTQSGAGSIKMQSTRNDSATGDLHFATVTFKTLKAGNFAFVIHASSQLINYPNNYVSFTTAGASYGVAAPPQPTQPAPPKPAPTQPAPSKPAAPKPSSKPAPAPSAPSTSTPSATNLQISDFSITDIGYRSAVLRWNTNRPATARVDYGDSSNNMPYEVSDPAKSANHQLTIQGDTLRAGRKYSVRITSDDGSGPTTLDGEFTTKPVVVKVKVTDAANQAVAGATVRTNVDQSTTNGEGIAEVGAPEGSAVITAEKDDLSADLTAEIALPESEDAAMQELSLTLSPADSTNKDVQAGRNIWAIIVPVIGVLAVLVIGIIVWRRRQANRKHVFGVDPDLGLVPTGEMPAPMPAQYGAPSAPPPYYTSLPDLVKQDLQAKRNQQGQQPPEQEPEDIFSPLDQPGQPPQTPTQPEQPPEDQLPPQQPGSN